MRVLELEPYLGRTYCMNKVESEIINMLKQGVPLRARDIARALGVTRREVNHYLYTSLQTFITQDQQYRWILKPVLQREEQLSLSFEITQKQSALDELLRQHQKQARETSLEQTLKSLIAPSEE